MRLFGLFFFLFLSLHASEVLENEVNNFNKQERLSYIEVPKFKSEVQF